MAKDIALFALEKKLHKAKYDSIGSNGGSLCQTTAKDSNDNITQDPDGLSH